MKQSRKVDSVDRLFFAGPIVFRPCSEGWLVISVESANWLVLYNDFQKKILEQLIEGKTVGEVFEIIETEEQKYYLVQLLSSIFARDFARTDSAPTSIYLEGYKMLNCYLTNACNLRCKHCFMQSGIKLISELPKDEWKRILTEFRKEGGETVTFSGGEPLMNIDFDEIVMHAYNDGLKVTILTNGTLWTNDRIERLAPYISEVQISLDGVDEDSNSVVRGGGHFAKVVDTIVTFANSGVRTSVATTFTLDNLQSDIAQRYEQLVNDIKSRSNSPIFFKLSKKVLNGRDTHYTEEQNRSFYTRILAIENAVDPNAQFNNFIEGHTPNLVAKNCGFGGISVGADGEVYFCNRISEVESYGNVREKAIKDFMLTGRQLHQRTGVDQLQPCRDCYLKYICCGGCRIDECNFQGKLTHFKDNLRQIKCTNETKIRLERKMVDSFIYYYKF